MGKLAQTRTYDTLDELRQGNARIEAKLDALDRKLNANDALLNDETEFTEVGSICVDSGRLLIADPCYLKNMRDSGGDGPVVPVLSGYALGQIVPTGYGDGIFGVYSLRLHGDLVGYFVDTAGYLNAAEPQGDKDGEVGASGEDAGAQVGP